MSNQPGQTGAGAYPNVSRVELERLLALESPDPHAVLGAHPTPSALTSFPTARPRAR